MTEHLHHGTTMKSSAWYKKPLYITLIITIIFLLISFFFSLLHPFLKSFLNFWKMIWWAVLLGLLISGMIEALIPSEYISNYLAKPNKKSIFYAATLGFVMASCSHGVLAISMELYKKGASIAAVITFLLASPWANLAVTILLFAFFGIKALLFISAAIVIAIISGFVYQYLEKINWIEKSKYSVEVPKSYSIRKDIKKRWQHFSWTKANIKNTTQAILMGTWSVSHMVLWWIIFGTLIGSVIDAFIPHHIFQQYLGPNLLGLIFTLGFATIIEVCSEGSAPIAFSIYKQTLAFGNAFIFLMAGVVTDITEIGLVWTNIGKRAAIWLPLVTVPQALIIAYCFNKFLS